MELFKIILLVFFVALTNMSCHQKVNSTHDLNLDELMVRLSEIEIDAAQLEDYLAILTEESAASVRLEPGVISIYPMFQKDNPTQIRILEIYANKEAYEAHLQTPHFKHYKSATLPMVKSLKLVDMEALDDKSMPEIFKKLNP